MFKIESNNSIYVSQEYKDVWNIIKDVVDSGNQELSFYICNIDDIFEKYRKWNTTMPLIMPYYAVKCNDHPIVIKVLAALGVGFDCASKLEIEKVLKLGVHPSRIIYAHTVKSLSYIRYAAEMNVNLLTFDNKHELHKLKNLFPTARAVIRIRYDAMVADILYGMKFGCDPTTEAPNLLRIARNLGINVVGVSFHVGTGCKDLSAFRGGIKAARNVFDIASTFGYQFNLLDIGGGYPGKQDDSIYEYGKVINSAIAEFFPDESIQIISEPGTYFVDSAFTLASNIHSLRVLDSEDEPIKQYVYYINESVFGSFKDVINYNVSRIPKPLKEKGLKKYLSIIRGETRCAIDQISSNVWLPKMELGDWLIFSNMGAYTLTLFSTNCEPPQIYNVISKSNCLLLKNNSQFSEGDFTVLREVV